MKLAARSKTVLMGFSGHRVTALGKVNLLVELTEGDVTTKTMTKFYIVDNSGNTTTLLGLPAIRNLKLIRNLDNITTKPDDATSVQDILNDYPEVFEGLGKHNKVVSLELKSNAVPRAIPPRVAVNDQPPAIYINMLQLDTSTVRHAI